jgi:hypothetical protein
MVQSATCELQVASCKVERCDDKKCPPVSNDVLYKNVSKERAQYRYRYSQVKTRPILCYPLSLSPPMFFKGRLLRFGILFA